MTTQDWRSVATAKEFVDYPTTVRLMAETPVTDRNKWGTVFWQWPVVVRTEAGWSQPSVLRVTSKRLLAQLASIPAPLAGRIVRIERLGEGMQTTYRLTLLTEA